MDETHPSGDIVALYFYNDGTFAYFNETLVGLPDTGIFTYAVYLDKPAGGKYSRDFRLVYSLTASGLQKWNGTSWVYVEDIIMVPSSSSNSVAFKVSLLSIANPDVQQDTDLLFVNSLKDGTRKHWVNLVYGKKNIDVGNVSLSSNGANLYVEIYVNHGWQITETYLKISKDPLSWSPPGHWPYEHEFDTPVTSDCYIVPLQDIGHGNLGLDPAFGVGPEDAVFAMVQASIRDSEGQDETAHACQFEGSCVYGDMATAFIASAVIPELPWPTPLVFIPAVTLTVLVIWRWSSKRSS